MYKYILFISETVDYLLSTKSSSTEGANVTNNDKRTCLHIAALTNNLDLCKILVNNGAKLNAIMSAKVRVMLFAATKINKNSIFSQELHFAIYIYNKCNILYYR